MSILGFFARERRAGVRKPEDTYTVSKAVIDACYLWREARFEGTLKRDIGWREARDRIRRLDRFGGRWTARVAGRAMRLTSEGLEVRFTHGLHLESWEDLQGRIRWWRN